MQRPRVPLPLLAILLLVATRPAVSAADLPNTLSDAERTAGWQLLFDGQTTRGWRGWRKDAFPEKGWIVRDGALGHVGKGGGGDIITERKFEDYEFAFEWRIAAGGNSGLKYFIAESRPGGAVGHEYQLIGHRDLAEVRRDLKHATASFYDVLPVSGEFPLRAPGEWHASRIVVRGNDVEHWLNGAKVLGYTLGSDAVKAGIATSKFRSVAGFGTHFPHHILLQDHGGEIWFRNLKLRPIKP